MQRCPDRAGHSKNSLPLGFLFAINCGMMVCIMARPKKNAPRPAPGPLAESVARLSRMLTRERDDLPAAYLKDKGNREAYLGYFLPANLPKVHLPLRELSLHPGNLFARDRLRVLDLGSGPGTALLGVRDHFVQQDRRPVLEFTAVDQVEENLRAAKSLFGELEDDDRGRSVLRTVMSPIESAGQHLVGQFDIVILSNVLNELFRADKDRIGKRTTFLGLTLDRLLADAGSCIIIEPALQETSRDLLGVRDGLVDAGFGVYSPCLVQGRCPALANPRDWCHEDRPWDPPAQVREIDRRIGLRKDALKFSYLVLRKDGRSLADVCGPDAFRVVSEPLVSKGKRELYLCGREGRRRAMRLDKDAAPGNRPFDQLLRGDVVRCEGMAVEERLFRITKGTQVLPLLAFRERPHEDNPLP